MILNPRESRPGGTNNDLPFAEEIDQELQKAMYVAIELLKMLRRFDLDPRQSTQIQAEITTVSQWMEFLIEQREHAASEAVDQKPAVVKLVARVLCDACREKAKHNRYRANSQERPAAPSPVWKRQLAFLLACTNRVGTELFSQACSSYHLKAFPNCVKKLRKALLRQWQYLNAAEAGAPNIEVEHRCCNTCEECGQFMELPTEGVS